MEVIARGDVYQFRWDAGSQYDGVGVQNGNIIAVSYTTGSNGKGCGVVDYDIQGDGTLDGKWGYWGTNEMGTETATRTGGPVWWVNTTPRERTLTASNTKRS
jgi:hypothetical protein